MIPQRRPSRADTSIPTAQMFSEGNGGESRHSFHGYPDGFAQLIASPRPEWSFEEQECAGEWLWD